jgi:hypothetical protein
MILISVLGNRVYPVALYIVATLLLPQQDSPSPKPDQEPNGASVISVRVVNKSGEAVSSARVLALTGKSEDVPLMRITDKSGSAVFSNAPSGHYFVVADHEGYRQVSKRIDVSGDCSETLILVTVNSIRGKVVDADGKAVKGVKILALGEREFAGMRSFNQRGEPTESAGDGSFVLNTLAADRYFIYAVPPTNPGTTLGGELSNAPTYYPNGRSVSDAMAVELSDSSDEADIRIRLVRTRTFQISGSVSGANAKGALAVSLYEIDGNSIVRTPSQIAKLVSPGSAFHLSGVKSGDYFLSLYPDQTRGHAYITVDRKNIQNVEVATDSDLKIEGELKTDGGKKLPDLKLSKVIISAWPIHQGADPSRVSTARPTLDGNLVLPRLWPGIFRVRVEGLPEQAFLSEVRIGGRKADSGCIDLRDGSQPRLELTINWPAAQISGTVLNREGSAIPNALVRLVSQRSSGEDKDSEIWSGTDGHFARGSIAPGDYLIYAISKPDDDIHDPVVVSRDRERAQSISLRPGTLEKAEIKVLR